MTSELITTALKRFQLAEEAEDQFRPAALDDLKFSGLSEQWPQGLPTNVLNNNTRLTIDQTGPYIRQITNDQRQNRPSLKITATDDENEDTAEVLEGIVRHIQAQSDADIAYDTACDSQVRIGFGYFRVLTDYCNEMSFDQDIKIKRIKNSFSVYFDPAAIEPDYSDAKWCFIVQDVLKEDFKAQYPDSQLTDLSFQGTGDSEPGWMTEDFIRIAEYFVVEEKPFKLYRITDGQQIQDVRDIDPKNLPMGWGVLKERESKERAVKWYKINGYEKLEENDWAGKYIPVVPVLGEDLDIDGRRSLRGLIRTMKDPQRMYNYWTSAATQAIALAPKSPWVVAVGQIKGLEKFWETANTANWSHLPYNVVLGADKPARDVAEPPIQAMSAAINQAANDLSRVTGIFKEGLGEETNADSGKAIIARQKEGDIATYHFQDNLARSIKHLGRILLDLIPKIYDAPRIMRMLNEDGSSKIVKVNQPSDDKDDKGIAKIYDLSTGEYDVAVNVGPSYTTKRQESADAMVALIQADNSIMQKAGDLVVHQMDFPGHDQLAKRLKMFLPPEIQAQEDGDDPLPPAIKQKMQQMSQMVGHLSEALHKAVDQLEEKDKDRQSKERIAAANNEAGIVEAIIYQAGDANLAFAQHELDRIAARESALHGMAADSHAAELSAINPPENNPAPAAQ